MRLINTDMGVVESGLIIGHIGSRGGGGGGLSKTMEIKQFSAKLGTSTIFGI